jgi:hypothetical protein
MDSSGTEQLGGKKWETLVALEKNREGKGKDGNAVPTNASRSISRKREPASKTTERKESHQAKHLRCRTSTDSGISILSNVDQEKADSSIIRSLEFDSKVTDVRLLHWKQDLHRTSTEAGSII